MINFTEIKVSEIFDILGENSKLTKTFIDENKGKFPVYSGDSKSGKAYGYIDFYKYEEELLIWTTYGDAGNLKMANGQFNIGRNASGLRVKNKFKEKINIRYIKYFCEIYFRLNAQGGKGELRKLPQQRVKNIFIRIPSKDNGEFDLEKQIEIAGKYEKLQKIKSRIRTIKEDIESQKIKLEEIGNAKEVSIVDLFHLKRGRSLYTRVYGDNNRGVFPVYSAGKEKLTSINTFDYDGEYLTWATNGFAGFLKKLNGKFSLNADRGIFICKSKRIDINFINHSIAIDLRNLTKGRIGDKGKNEFTKLSPKKIEDNIFIRIPIKKNGDFDLERQKEIAQKYMKIENIKNNLIQELEYLEKVKVEI